MEKYDEETLKYMDLINRKKAKRSKVPSGQPTITVNKKTGRPIGPYVQRIGSGLGKGLRAVGSGIAQASSGFAEGLGAPAGQTTREAGRLVGRGIRSTAKTVGKLQVRDPRYVWGSRLYGGSSTNPQQQGYLGYGQRPVSSHLPMEVQSSMVQYLADLYPEFYNQLYRPGMSLSEMIGTLKMYNPELYEGLKDSVYSSIAPGSTRPQYRHSLNI